jgi:hypothetical protein
MTLKTMTLKRAATIVWGGVIVGAGDLAVQMCGGPDVGLGYLAGVIVGAIWFMILWPRPNNS